MKRNHFFFEWPNQCTPRVSIRAFLLKNFQDNPDNYSTPKDVEKGGGAYYIKEPSERRMVA